MVKLDTLGMLGMFDELDNIFFLSLINGEFAKQVEFYIKKSLEYNFDLEPDIVTSKKDTIKMTNLKTKKVSETSCFMIGIFDTTTNVFAHSAYKNIFYENLIKTNYFNDSMSTLKKLFSNRTINITREQHYIIPYLCAIVASNKLNVIRFTSEGFIAYCLIELNYPLSLDSFEKDIASYRFYLETIKIMNNPLNSKSRSLSRSLKNVQHSMQNTIKDNMTNKYHKSHKNKDIKRFVSRMTRTKLIKTKKNKK
jgi:hypothetical protein